MILTITVALSMAQFGPPPEPQLPFTYGEALQCYGVASAADSAKLDLDIALTGNFWASAAITTGTSGVRSEQIVRMELNAEFVRASRKYLLPTGEVNREAADEMNRIAEKCGHLLDKYLGSEGAGN